MTFAACSARNSTIAVSRRKASRAYCGGFAQLLLGANMPCGSFASASRRAQRRGGNRRRLHDRHHSRRLRAATKRRGRHKYVADFVCRTIRLRGLSGFRGSSVFRARGLPGISNRADPVTRCRQAMPSTPSARPCRVNYLPTAEVNAGACCLARITNRRTNNAISMPGLSGTSRTSTSWNSRPYAPDRRTSAGRLTT